MYRSRLSRRTLAAIAGTAALAATLTTATAFASDDRAPAVSVGMTGDFTFHACPAGTPAADACLTDHLTGSLPGLGGVTGEFEVHLAISQAAADQCEPIDKHGTFTTAKGHRLQLVAEGMFCAAQGIASYDYRVVSGGTGHGQWLVPPPDTFANGSGSGPEYFFGSLEGGGR